MLLSAAPAACCVAGPALSASTLALVIAVDARLMMLVALMPLSPLLQPISNVLPPLVLDPMLLLMLLPLLPPSPLLLPL
jgi:hypothetical protein